MPATVKDIARHLGISTSTVCYALNGGPRTVNEETRQKVLATARDLDYRPNRVARSLAIRTSDTIGVVPPSTETDVFQSPFVRAVWNAIVNEAELLGLDLLLFAGRNLNTREEEGVGLLDGRTDGVVFIAPMPGALAPQLLYERKFPFASISGRADAPGVHFVAENRSGMAQAVAHLVELGHRRIAHIAGSADFHDGQERRSAFEGELAKHKIRLEPTFIAQKDFTRDFGYHAARQLFQLPVPPTAILAANDELAFGVYIAARELGLSIPHDLSVIGFDDSELCPVLYPSLTTIRQPIADMASAAMRAVVHQIRTGKSLANTHFSTQLILRDSTAPPQPAGGLS